MIVAAVYVSVKSRVERSCELSEAHWMTNHANNSAVTASTPISAYRRRSTLVPSHCGDVLTLATVPCHRVALTVRDYPSTASWVCRPQAVSIGPIFCGQLG